jgi:hypothetical protein
MSPLVVNRRHRRPTVPYLEPKIAKNCVFPISRALNGGAKLHADRSDTRRSKPKTLMPATSWPCDSAYREQDPAIRAIETKKGHAATTYNVFGIDGWQSTI